jgi:hypothetical protein
MLLDINTQGISGKLGAIFQLAQPSSSMGSLAMRSPWPSARAMLVARIGLLRDGVGSCWRLWRAQES